MSTVAEAKLAAIAGLTTARLRQLAEEGHIPPPQKGRYETGPAVSGLIKYYRTRANAAATDYRAARARRENNQADLLEAEKKRVLGELVDIKEARALLGTVLRAVRQALLPMPRTLGPLVNPGNPRAATTILTDWLDRMLPLVRDQIANEAAPDGAAPIANNPRRKPAKSPRRKPRAKRS